MQGSKGSGTYLSGLKEVYFGRMLRGTNVTAEFIEAIGSWEESIFNLYLVSRYEGMSLKQLLYEGNHTSNWWHWIKTTQEGQNTLRNIMFQLVRSKI